MILSSHSYSTHSIYMQRTSLATITSNRRSRTELSSFQRELFMRAVNAKATLVKVERLCEVKEFIVRYTLLQSSTRNNEITKSRSDRFKSLSVRDRRHIVRIARLESKIIYQKLIEKARIECHRKIVYRVLKEYELIN